LVDIDNPAAFANIEQKIPDIYQNSQGKLSQITRPRILKSHEYFDPRYKKVIYIVRDPRDVIISYYHYHIKMNKIQDDYSIEKFASKFINGQLDNFGTWAENVGSWLGARKNSHDFLLLRYEDMLENPRDELEKVASFLSLNFSINQLGKIIQFNSFQNMQKLERKESNLWKPIKYSRKDNFFVRIAHVGSWKTEISSSIVRKIEVKWKDIMDELGYY
jgi:hypothetical protein